MHATKAVAGYGGSLLSYSSEDSALTARYALHTGPGAEQFLCFLLFGEVILWKMKKWTEEAF